MMNMTPDPMTISDDDAAMIYDACLNAFALLMPDALITAFLATPDSARDFISSLAYDPDASTESPADCMIAPYQLIIDLAYALDDPDLIDDLIARLIDNDRIAADAIPTLNTYLH